MRLLIDTHLLLWTAGQSARLSPQARSLIGDPANELLFSAASLWEIAIKAGLGRGDFRVDANQLRRGLLNNGYRELAITGEHAVAVTSLPMIHRDPFDRLLLAQGMVENITLLTSDAVMAQYPVAVQQV
jgi:PIN domain nuclease of toxin-antitoxin system